MAPRLGGIKTKEINCSSLFLIPKASEPSFNFITLKMAYWVCSGSVDFLPSPTF